MSWPGFIEKGKISLRLLLPIAIVSGCILFLPPNYKEKLGISSLSSNYSQYTGLAFLFTTVLVLIDFILSIVRAIRIKRNNIKISGYVEEYINNLIRYEKSLIREFFLTDSDTLPLPHNNPIVNGLISKRILIQVGNAGSMVKYEICFNYCLTELSKRFLTPQKIDLPKDPNSAEGQIVLSERFKWWKFLNP